MNKIQQSDTFRNTTITQTVGLVLDNDLNMLIITYRTSRLIQQRELTGNMTGKKSLSTIANAQPISYHQGVYYVGINPSAPAPSFNIYAYNTTLANIVDMSFSEGEPKRAVWLYNNSPMCLFIMIHH